VLFHSLSLLRYSPFSTFISGIRV